MNKKLILTFLFLLLLTPTIVLAQDPPGDGNPGTSTQGVTLQNPIKNNDPAKIIGDIIKGILGLTGVLALVAFIAGGVMMMTSGGNPEKVKKGKDILVWAVIGLFIIFTSYNILKYIFDMLR
jgi:type IV secretory pathway VirB2 component (pilin)